jgi:ESCRT-II complex subunit VPS22
MVWVGFVCRQHANDIKKNPQFRAHFQRMCAQVGVDPLACMYAARAQTECGAAVS